MQQNSDLSGKKFGQLTAIRAVGKDADGRSVWKFLCECGTRKDITARWVISGHSTSCGCYALEQLVKRNFKHGQATSKKQSPEYKAWVGMKKRIFSKSYHAYEHYKSRGITICDRWLDKDHGFENFYNDMGPKPSPEYTLDRKDNDKGYSPDNCRWLTQAEQMNNTSSNKLLTYQGKTMTQEQWGLFTGIGGATICKRLKRGWSLEKTLTIPLGQEKGQRFLEYRGIVKPIREWASLYNKSHETISFRLASGWSIHDALTKPLRPHKRKK